MSTKLALARHHVRGASRTGSNSIHRRSPWILLYLLAIPGLAGNALAQALNANAPPSMLRNVGIDQRLNEQIPLDLEFRSESGKATRLRQFFGEKPVVLSLVYFDCPMLCTLVENGLLESLRTLKFSVGKEFDVLTVSFDPHDKPELAAAKKRIYVGLYGRKGASEGWHFLTGDEASIHELTKAVGFRYNYDPRLRQFAHATSIMVLTPEGKLSRYFYGIQYPPGDLRLALVDASARRIGSPVDRVLLYCWHYDPATGKYGLIVSRALHIGALVTVLSLGTLMWVMFRAGRRTAS